MDKPFESLRAPEPVGAFPHAKRVGNFLFLSGIGPRTRGAKEIPGVTLDSGGNVVSYDIEKQCRAVFENVRLVLEDAGASWNDIVDVTVFLTNIKKDFRIYNGLYAEYFAGDAQPTPTRTTIEVTALPTPIARPGKASAAAFAASQRSISHASSSLSMRRVIAGCGSPAAWMTRRVASLSIFQFTSVAVRAWTRSLLLIQQMNRAQEHRCA